jgi:predicted esterase
MKNTILFIGIMYCLTSGIYAQLCNNQQVTCYQQNACYTDSQINTRDYKYATVHNIYKSSNASIDLLMTVYSPCSLPINILSNSLSACKACKRPFILMMHGGGLRGGCRNNLAEECIEFAKRGYVAATIDYRLGWVPGDEKIICNTGFCFIKSCAARQNDNCNPAYNDSLNFEIYRALQDASAALRFIVHFADNLNIDTNSLYIEGHSSGSIIATRLCYMNQKDINIAIPAANAILGSLVRSGNPYTESYKIAGLFNNWGSMSDTVFIKGTEDKIPMIAFHGIDDSIVPCEKGFPLGCTNGAYGYNYGSSLIYQRLIHNYQLLPVELYVCYGGHGIFNDDPATDQKTLYRIQKAICFFNRVRNGDKTQTYISVNKQEDSIAYNELDSISPVNCGFTGIQKNIVSYITNTGNNHANMQQAKPSLSFIISPNPATSQATLFIKGEYNEINIAITDLQGSVLWHQESVRGKSISLPVKNFGNGLYLVIIKNSGYTSVIKLVK